MPQAMPCFDCLAHLPISVSPSDYVHTDLAEVRELLQHTHILLATLVCQAERDFNGKLRIPPPLPP